LLFLFPNAVSLGVSSQPIQRFRCGLRYGFRAGSGGSEVAVRVPCGSGWWRGGSGSSGVGSGMVLGGHENFGAASGVVLVVSEVLVWVPGREKKY
jgi:hypothetical protein